MSTTTALETLKSRFESLFGRPPAGLVRAPGRVNLIGEHTDYNDGFVLPIAIDRQTLAGWAGRADRRVVFASLQVEAPAEIDLDAPIEKGEPAWANYCRGVAAGLRSAGVPLAGADILFDSDVPIGGGLSSSASLEVATAMALLAAAGAVGRLEGRELALICQKASTNTRGPPAESWTSRSPSWVGPGTPCCWTAATARRARCPSATGRWCCWWPTRRSSTPSATAGTPRGATSATPPPPDWA